VHERVVPKNVPRVFRRARKAQQATLRSARACTSSSRSAGSAFSPLPNFRVFIPTTQVTVYSARPGHLHPPRARAAAWIGCSADDFTHALIAQYPPGSRLGWHRDVPDFELVVGISPVGACRMRFRHYPPCFREKSIALESEPRSIYRLQDEARWEWQHSVPPMHALRYSITLRTLRRRS